MAHSGALLVCAARLRQHRRSHLRQAAQLLSLHPAGLDLIAGWLLTLAVLACILAVLFILITGGTRALGGRFRQWLPIALARAFHYGRVSAARIALRVYIGRFELLFEHHTIFDGVTYTDAHVTLMGMLFVAAALVLGALIAFACAVIKPRGRMLVVAIVPAADMLCGCGHGRLVRQQLHRKAQRTGARAALYRSQHRDDPAGIRTGPLRAT